MDELMTAEEKQKLYTAIGYSGSSHSLNLPSQYVAVVLSFQLCKTSVTGGVPSLMSSVSDSSSSLLTLEFEVNPESSKADQMLRVRSQSVQILYDASGKAVDLELLTSATLSKLEEIKEKTTTDQKVLDLRIDLQPSSCCCLTWSSAPPPSSSLEEIMDRATRNTTWSYDESRCSTAEQPLDFSLQAGQEHGGRDARMPRFKVSGELPLLHLKISDRNIHGLLDLVDSIPLPNMLPASTHTERCTWYGPFPRRLGDVLGGVWERFGGRLEEV
ncbi:hypothetical protein F7725_025720 [Dissostichus mawsoni]|uniref:Uncharacterized protein n=1 Tax=Dissostichus mawsoni TaxID=36200 RepID=A0A7J5X517_DISMA|nr:hypothetical protein F7725_025720 [Dissostichus mawsoni]